MYKTDEMIAYEELHLEYINEISDKYIKALRERNSLLKQKIFLIKLLDANHISIPFGELDAI